MLERLAQGRIAAGLGLALRSSATSVMLGLRWTAGQAALPDVPEPQRGIAFASKRALDEFFFVAEMMTAPLVSPGDVGRLAGELAAAGELFEARGWFDRPETYHETPPPLARLEGADAQASWLPYRHVRFESGYAPRDDEPGRERWLSYDPVRTAHAWLLEHPGAPRPWILCVPGYRMGTPLVDFMGFRARWLHRALGLNVAIPVLPLHGPRRVGWISGDGFFTGDFLDTVHAQSQAIWDIRRLVGWIRDERGAPALAAYGVSLGAHTAALLAGLEERLDCIVAGIPAADFVRLFRRHAPAVLLRAAERIGFTFESVERLMRVVSPLVLAPRVPRERRFLFGALGDRLCSPDHTRDLWHHWEQPRVAWYHGSHVSFLWEPEVKELLAEALAASGLVSTAS